MYQEAEKNWSRRLIWRNAINALTTSRVESRVISDEFMANGGQLLRKRQPKLLGPSSRFSHILRDWRYYADSEYGARRPQDLKVAYLCGPNPKNDLHEMVRLGVAIQNVWAIESERGAREQALGQARASFPELKIVPFKAHRLFEAPPTTFDIVYLDFTAPLFSMDKKPYETLHMLFDAQALADLSVLIVNSSFPDDNPGNRIFMASFLAALPAVPAALTDDKLESDPAFDRKFERYTDGGGPRGETPFEFAENLAQRDPQALYSAFATGYPIAYASAIQPYLRTLKQDVLRQRAFAADDVVSKQLERFTDATPVIRSMLGLDRPGDVDDLTSGFMALSPEGAPLSWWLRLCGEQPEGSPGRRWFQIFDANPTHFVSRRSAIERGDLLRCALEGYLETLSGPLRKALAGVMSAIPDREFPLFADAPMPPLWIETAINQLGAPHHANVDRHRRYSYRARTREMCLDIFVFDRCRPFYNWLPLPELYGDDLARFGRQMVARLCLDAIGKQTHELVPYSLRYASVVPKSGSGYPYTSFANLRLRRTIRKKGDVGVQTRD